VQNKVGVAVYGVRLGSYRFCSQNGRLNEMKVYLQEVNKAISELETGH